MKANKIFVGENNTEIELGCSAIHATLYFGVDMTMYIKCNAGDIQESDTLLFARYITRINRTHIQDGVYRYEARYRGWITPNAGTLEKYDIHFVKSLQKTENGYDYWKVYLANGMDVPDYERWRDAVKSSEPYRTNSPLSMRSKCGIAIVRNGVQISDFLRFRVVHHLEKDIYTATRW